MQMITTGNVTLPDGRVVHAVEKWEREWMDGHPFASNMVSIEIEWMDGTPLEADEYNEKIAYGYYLHEWVSEQLAFTGEAEPGDTDPF